MVSEKREGAGDGRFQFRNQCWLDRVAADCALDYGSLRMANGFHRNRSAWHDLDCRVAGSVPKAARERSGFGGRVSSDSKRSRGRGCHRGSVAQNVAAAPSVGGWLGQVFYRSYLVRLFVLDAGFLEPEPEARSERNGPAVVRHL